MSAALGDRALIFPDGRMEGFVGGACARDIVRTRALAVLQRGRPQLLSIRPGLEGGTADLGDEIERLIVPMGCASEGAIDIYIEPHGARRQLVVIGFTPVAEAAARLAAMLDYDVTRFVLANELAQLEPIAGTRALPLDELAAFVVRADAGGSDLAAVVASQGHYDETALERLLAIPLSYVGVLASRKRMEALRGVLSQGGVEPERLQRVRNPIGLDINARLPGEIALAILAEIVALGPATLAARDTAPAQTKSATATAFDPVCGMEVEAGDGALTLEHAGVTQYFCCDGCARRFAAEPERFAVALERA